MSLQATARLAHTPRSTRPRPIPTMDFSLSPELQDRLEHGAPAGGETREGGGNGGPLNTQQRPRTDRDRAGRQVTAGCSSRIVPASASISTGSPTGSVSLRRMWPNIAPRYTGTFRPRK